MFSIINYCNSFEKCSCDTFVNNLLRKRARKRSGNEHFHIKNMLKMIYTNVCENWIITRAATQVRKTFEGNKH